MSNKLPNNNTGASGGAAGNPVSAEKILSCAAEASALAAGGMCAPRTVELFVTTACNHSCAGCHTAKLRGGAAGHLDIATAVRLLDEWRGLGVRGLEVSGVGEPLLYPHLAELLSRAAALGFSAGLLTNGSLLHTADSELLLRNTRFIRVSYDSCDRDSYRAIHGADDLAGVEKNVAGLVRARREGGYGTTIGMKTLLSKHNAGQAGAIAARASRLGVDYIQFKALRNGAASLSPAELKREAAEIEKLRGKRGKGARVIGSLEKQLLERPCFLSPLHPVVGPDGSLYVCPYYSHHSAAHRIGSLKKRTFASLWGSAAHRRAVSEIDSSVCNVFDCPLIPFNNFAWPNIVEDGMHLDFI